MKAEKIALLFFIGLLFALTGLLGATAASYSRYDSNYYTHYLPSYGWNGFINYEYSRPYYSSSYYYRPAYFAAALPRYYGAYYGSTLYRGYNHYNYYQYTPVNYLFYVNNDYHFYYPKPVYHPSYWWAW